MENYFNFNEEQKKDYRTQLVCSLYSVDIDMVEYFDVTNEYLVKRYLEQLLKQAHKAEDYFFVAYVSDTLKNKEYILSHYGL